MKRGVAIALLAVQLWIWSLAANSYAGTHHDITVCACLIVGIIKYSNFKGKL